MRHACTVAMTVMVCALTGRVTYAGPSKYEARLITIFLPGDSVYFKDDPESCAKKWSVQKRWITKDEWRRGFVDLGTVVVCGESYLPYEFHPAPIVFNDALLDTSSWRVSTRVPTSELKSGWEEDAEMGPTGWTHCLSREYFHKSVPRERDPTFTGFVKSLHLTISSEPPGARLYANGRLVDTIPVKGLTLTYSLGATAYRQGYILGDSLTLVRFGYVPKFFRPRFEVAVSEREDPLDIDEYQLVILDRDPLVPAQLLVQPVYTQQSSPQYDASRARAYEDAKAEYEQALVNWEAAMRDCDNTGLNAQAINNAASGSNWASFLDNLGSLAKQDAARKVQVAKETLERAKAKLQALEWK